MSQLGFATCRGAPRDLGFDQGRALADEIRADLRALGLPVRGGWRASLRPQPTPGWDAALARDLARHFPHLDERLTGVADGVDCPRESIAALIAQELRRGLLADARYDAAAQHLDLVLRQALPPTGLAVRRVEPDGGYANLGATRPGFVFGLAGVNEHGLAGVAQLDAPTTPGDRCRAPGLLLLDQCIERLDSVEKALEWCERRPGGGRVRLVFADATGAAGAIEIDGEQRKRVAAPTDPIDAAGGARVRVDLAARTLAIEGGGIAPGRFALATEETDPCRRSEA